MSKPLVTEMLEFLNTKSKQGEATSEMTKLIYDIQSSLKECIQQANLFSKAAHYDSGAANVPFSSLKEGGIRNPGNIDTNEFQKLVNGDAKENDQPTVNLAINQSAN